MAACTAAWPIKAANFQFEVHLQRLLAKLLDRDCSSLYRFKAGTEPRTEPGLCRTLSYECVRVWRNQVSHLHKTKRQPTWYGYATLCHYYIVATCNWRKTLPPNDKWMRQNGRNIKKPPSSLWITNNQATRQWNGPKRAWQTHLHTHSSSPGQEKLQWERSSQREKYFSNSITLGIRKSNKACLCINLKSRTVF